MTLSVIVPAYNEEQTVGEALTRLINKEFIDEVILVNDGSTDNTLSKAEEVKQNSSQAGDKLTIISMSENRGKGSALREGISKSSGDIIVICDADLEYDPGDFQNMLSLMESKHADAVYGSRFLEKRSRYGTGFIHFFANWFLTKITNILYGAHLTDMETCFKMVKGDTLRSLDLHSNSFDIEVEITAKLRRKKIRILEVPISYDERNYNQGKKIKWYHGIHALWALFKYRISRK
jgi:glycosyltransferase involved in cell wall biosynthesis